MTQAAYLSRRGLEALMPEAAAAIADVSLRRVALLPTRVALTEAEIEDISAAFRVREWGVDRSGRPRRNVLRRAQAEAIRELYDLRALFGPLSVGSGKTLVTLLAATLLRATNPALLVPAVLREKTQRDFQEYSRDWRVRLPRLWGYEELGLESRDGALEGWDPHTRTKGPPHDLVLADEADYLRNLDGAGRTVRVERMIERARPVFVPLSGTLITDKLMDSHHLAVWSLGERAPVPLQRDEAKRWAQAVDSDLGTRKRLTEGAIALLPGGFHTWFRTRRGVVAAMESDCNASIVIAPWEPRTPDVLRAAIDSVLATSMRPDGVELTQWDQPDCLCELAQGFYLHWDPEPPAWWMAPRRAWHGFAHDVRELRLDGLDTLGQIASAIDRGDDRMPPEATTILAAWRAVKDRFEPNSVPVWFSGEVMDQAAAWARRTNGIVWATERAVGWALRDRGIPYFGGNTDPERDAVPGRPMVLSTQAHSRGANLQHGWSSMLFLHPSPNPILWEQRIGRVHREGQRASTIAVDVIRTIDYHRTVLRRTKYAAEKTSHANGFDHKLVIADWAT
jgi:hypothetical protein